MNKKSSNILLIIVAVLVTVGLTAVLFSLYFLPCSTKKAPGAEQFQPSLDEPNVVGPTTSPPTDLSPAPPTIPPVTPDETGGQCSMNEDCETLEYCRKTAGDCHSVGECASRPEFCTLDYTPVCGCDAKTYGNACSAAGAGVNVMEEGECSTGIRL